MGVTVIPLSPSPFLEDNWLFRFVDSLVGSTISKSPPRALFNPEENEFLVALSRITWRYKTYHSLTSCAVNMMMNIASMKNPILLSLALEKSFSSRARQAPYKPTSPATEIISTNCTFFLIKGFFKTRKKSWKDVMDKIMRVGILEGLFDE